MYLGFFSRGPGKGLKFVFGNWFPASYFKIIHFSMVINIAFRDTSDISTRIIAVLLNSTSGSAELRLDNICMLYDYFSTLPSKEN